MSLKLEGIKKWLKGEEPSDLYPQFREVENAIDEVLSQKSLNHGGKTVSFHSGGVVFGHDDNSYFFEEWKRSFGLYKYRFDSTYIQDHTGQKIHSDPVFQLIDLRTNTPITLENGDVKLLADKMPLLIDRAKTVVQGFIR